MSAEKNPARQEAPRDHRPTARDVDPLLAGIHHDQRSQGKRKRDCEAHISQVEHGRMNHHLGILEQGVKSIAISGNVSRDE